MKISDPCRNTIGGEAETSMASLGRAICICALIAFDLYLPVHFPHHLQKLAFNEYAFFDKQPGKVNEMESLGMLNFLSMSAFFRNLFCKLWGERVK